MLWDPKGRVFYVSNLKGWISLVSADGKLLAARWVEGLRAPRGLALGEGLLYAADVDAVVSVDTAYAKVVRRAPVPGASSLTGLAAAKDGSVYASDTLTNRIFRVARDGAVSEAAGGSWAEGPGGLFLKGDRLFVAAWGLAAPDYSTKVAGRIYSLELKTKKRRDVSPVPLGNLAGLALEAGRSWKDPSGWLDGPAWLTTDHRAGKLWRVVGGAPALLLDGLKQPAGLDYDPKRRLAVVALTGEDAVAAWDLTRFPR